MARNAAGLAQAEPRFRERALRNRRRPWRRVLWLVLVGVVAAGVGWAVFFSSFLAVRTIDVSGVNGSDRSEVLGLVDVPDGTPLARVDLEGVEQRVRTKRNIAEVSVERGWPSTLRVRAVPRQPALVLKNPQGQLEVVDATGVSYGTVVKAPAGVPVVTAATTKGTTKPALEAALSVVRTLPDDLAERVSAIRVSTANLVSFTIDDITIVWGGSDEADRKLAILRALLPTKPDSIDVSAPGSPVTRGGASPSPSDKN